MRYLISVLLFLIAFPFNESPVSQNLFLGNKAMIFLNSKDTTSFHAIRKVITDNDGHMIHCFAPRIMQGYLTDKAKYAIEKTGLVSKIITNRYDTNSAGLSKKDLFIVNSWNKRFIKNVATRGNDGSSGNKDKPVGKADRNETSEYMIGSTAVGIVFVESDGTKDQKTESWTQEDKEDVFYQIQKGLEWWSEKGGYRASLTWTYEFKTVKTQFEPINHFTEDSDEWVKDVSLKLGYGAGNSYDINRNYANALREKYRTDWAFVLFVVTASNDEDGDWKDKGPVAWANLGGPLMVINNRCDGWGETRIWEVVAHETGHIFNALDEYKGASNGNERHGLLNVINGNAEEGGIVNKKCIMKANETQLCEFSAGQIGWVDDNQDGIFEVDYLNLSKTFNLALAKKEAENIKSSGQHIRIDFVDPLIEKNKKFYTEDFTRNTRSWKEDGKTAIRKGYYLIDGNSEMPIWLPDVYNDFIMTLNVKWTGGEETMGFSLDVASSPSGIVYSVAVTGDGYEAHNTAKNGETFSRNYLPHKAIKMKDWNTIKIECKNNDIRYFINNQLIVTFRDENAIDRSIGINVDPNTTAAFDNLIISK